MSEALKITFETPDGTKVVRQLRTVWTEDSIDMIELSRQYNSKVTEDEFKTIVAGVIAAEMNTEFIKDVLNDLIKQSLK